MLKSNEVTNLQSGSQLARSSCGFFALGLRACFGMLQRRLQLLSNWYDARNTRFKKISNEYNPSATVLKKKV
jgi:hypothetical protein